MKRIAIAIALLLSACAPQHTVYYFVPEMELADGEITPTKTFPVPSLKECVALAKEFDKDMAKEDEVIAHSSECIRGSMKLQQPTQSVEQFETPRTGA